MPSITNWVEVHTDVTRHPQTLQLARQMDLSRRETVGLLIDLWTWALDVADRDGRLEGMTGADLAAVLELRGKRKALLVPSLTRAGFLEQDGDTLVLHNWYAYTGRLNDTREKNRQRVRRHRAKEAAEKNAADNSGDESEAKPPEGEFSESITCNGDVTVTGALRNGATRPDQTEPDQTVPDRTKPYQTENVVSDETTTKGGTPPSLSEIERFCVQKGGTEAQAAAFFAQYSASGWLANGAPIASWQGLLTNFLRQGGQFHPSCTPSPRKAPAKDEIHVPPNARKNAEKMRRFLEESGDWPRDDDALA